MIIYPDGNRNEKGSEHISVYLAITGTGKLQRFHSVKSEWGLPKFLPHKIFKEAGYLVYDKCSFGAEILVGQDSTSVRREWKIRNFSNLGVDWMSEEFTTADHKWIIKLQPKGTVHHEEYQVSIYLCSVDSKNFDPNQKLKANCSICINDQIKGGGYKRSYCTWFATTKNVRGYPQFIPLTQLLDNKKGYIVNDCICIAVEIEFTHRVKSLVILD
ncbi:hypothetical protein KY289_008286 [Solanum tuberosum]|nr:hypothetical protein KY289_008286 [Solanum tuberosum]